MKIEAIKLAALNNFFNSEKIQKQKNLPITSLRVASQIKNPSAKKEDIVLVVAFNMQDEIIAYCGALPTKFNDEESLKICFSSCWWKHPKKGNLAALKVFAKLLKAWQNQMLFDDLPKNSVNILKKFETFEFEEQQGKKYFLRFNLKEWVPNKLPNFKFATTLFFWLDVISNFSYNLFKKKEKLKEFTFEKIEFFDEQSLHFIAQKNDNQFFNRNFEELNWMLKHKWLSNQKLKFNNESKKYHFSLLCNTFENQVYKIFKNNKLVAIVWLTNRNGNFKLPYLFALENNLNDISIVLKHILQQQKAVSFLTFQPQINNLLVNLKCIHKKNICKTFAYPKALKSRFATKNKLQDGDGDFVFT